MGLESHDILTQLSSSFPCLEKHFIFRYVPDYVGEEAVHEDHHIIIVSWKTLDEADTSYCEDCIKTKNNIVKRLEVFTTFTDELIYGYLNDDKYWCSQCLCVPLIQLIDTNTHVISTQYIGRYQNLEDV